MTDPTFNLAMLQIYPNWYDHIDKVEAAMREQDRIDSIRHAAGWDADEGGWISPCGIPESDWEHEYGYPFPEDDDYAAWASAFYHHDAVDNDALPELEATLTPPCP
jgi:hypothetical protein